MASGASEILFRTAIGAVNSTEHLRVYTQDTSGAVRESLYEGTWRNGTSANTIVHAKLGSPIAATSKELKEIRVYTLSENNVLTETAYSANRGWYTGDLGARGFAVAPYSKIGAAFLATGSSLQLRIYAQLPDNTIQEYGYDGVARGWEKMTNLGAALPGTSIATTSFRTSELSIRTYIQAPSLTLIEKAYDASRGWYNGSLTIPLTTPRASLAAISLTSTTSTVSIRLYHAAPSDRLAEKAYDGSTWYDGNFSQPSLPGTEVGVVGWNAAGGSATRLNVFFENGTEVSGVSEWVWNGGWVKGAEAIPPA